MIFFLSEFKTPRKTWKQKFYNSFDGQYNTTTEQFHKLKMYFYVRC